MSALARWCFRHKWVVVFLWVAALAGVGAGSSAAGAKYVNAIDLPDSESSRAMELMDEAFPDPGGESDKIVWQVREASVLDAAVRSVMTRTLRDVAKLPGVDSVESPYVKAGATQISEDGRTAYAVVKLDVTGDEKPTAEQMKDLVTTARAPASESLAVEVSGESVELSEGPAKHLSEIVGIAAAAVILFLAFGSFFGMLIPIVTALLAIGVAQSSIVLLSHVTDIGDVAPLLAVLVGLGVGIDYALFIVTRHRKGLLSGRDPLQSAVLAVAVSGRAVIFAGGTVCIALLGMFVLRLKVLDGIAIAASLAVALTMAASVTLLPALLGVFGMRVLGRRQRRRLALRGGAQQPARARHAARGPQANAGAGRWADFVERHPVALTAVTLIVMGAIAVPFLSLRLGVSDQGNNPEASTTRKAYDLLADGFGPGYNGPLTVVAEIPADGDLRALRALADDLRDTDGVAKVSMSPAPNSAKVGVILVEPTTSPVAEETGELIERLRADVVPAAERGSTMRAYVGGQTAIFMDFSSVLLSKLPKFLGVIVVLGFLLLMIAFRSLLVPLTAGLMNLIAAAASFGLVVAIFQFGWGVDSMNIGGKGPVEAFLPAIMLSLLFGLSMDYQVFLVSRMHEEWVATGDNARAVRIGLSESGPVIHSAALIMIFVFGSFALNGERMVVMFGIGLAAAVALDAFLLRSILVPALMYKFGRANWYLPGWLGKILPHVTIEPPEHEANALAGPEAEKAATARPAEPVPDEYVHGLAHPDPYEEPAAYEDAWADPYTQPHPDAPDAAPQTDPFADAHDDSGAVPYVPQGGPAAGLFLQGAVRSPEGAPVVGAALALISQSGRLVDHTVSDPHGMYALAVPGAEEYILAVTAEGYDPQITPLAVGDGSMEHWIVLGVRGDQNSEPVQNYF